MSGYYQSHRKEMVRYLPSGSRRVLDIGCGAGGFLEELRRHRPELELEGIEPNPAAAEEARGRGFAVTTGLFPDASPRGRGYDCIFLNDVLEHLVDPWGALRTIGGELLAPGATLVLSIPNVGNLATVLMLVVKGQWRYVDQGVLDRTHLRFFTRRSIERTLDEAGFVVECVDGAWPLVTPKMRLLRAAALAGGLRFYRECRYRQWHIVARPQS